MADLSGGRIVKEVTGGLRRGKLGRGRLREGRLRRGRGRAVKVEVRGLRVSNRLGVNRLMTGEGLSVGRLRRGRLVVGRW